MKIREQITHGLGVGIHVCIRIEHSSLIRVSIRIFDLATALIAWSLRPSRPAAQDSEIVLDTVLDRMIEATGWTYVELHHLITIERKVSHATTTLHARIEVVVDML